MCQGVRMCAQRRVLHPYHHRAHGQHWHCLCLARHDLYLSQHSSNLSPSAMRRMATGFGVNTLTTSGLILQLSNGKHVEEFIE